MIRRLIPIGCVCLVALTQTGCWDVANITDQLIINGVSLDSSESGGLAGTVRALRIINKGGGQFTIQDEVVSSTGNNYLDVGNKLNSMLPGNIVAGKIHIMILGRELAEHGIYSALEPAYRSPRGYLGAKVLISQDRAEDILSSEKKENSPIAFDILRMIKSAVTETIVPDQTLFSLWPKLSDSGRDFILPIIRINNQKKLVIDNAGLFDGGRFTGVVLSRDDSTTLLLLMNKLGQFARMNVAIHPIHPAESPFPPKPDTVTFRVLRMKRKMKISADDAAKDIRCSIHVDLYGEVLSYPYRTGLENDKDKLSRELAASITRKAETVVGKLLVSRCDIFGIGEYLRARHPKLWENLDWKMSYPEVKLEPSFTVHITSSGLLK